MSKMPKETRNANKPKKQNKNKNYRKSKKC